MSEEAVLAEDQSHYEISLTAGQAFVAFVLLLLSLAASFAFGLLIGKGQNDDRLASLKSQPAVVNEAAAVVTPAPKKKAVDVAADDFDSAAPAPSPATIEPKAAPAAGGGGAPRAAEGGGAPLDGAPVKTGPAYAQLLSSSDQKAAEALAEKLIGGGFTSAYVERVTTDKGMVYRVRVKFSSDAEAHAAEAKLKEFSKDVWITSK